MLDFLFIISVIEKVYYFAKCFRLFLVTHYLL